VRRETLADICGVAQVMPRVLVLGVNASIEQGEEIDPARIGRGYLLLTVTP
jgi:hypothetical protein